MSIFPLDSVRNARVDGTIELLLEAVREDVAAYPFSSDIGGAEAVLEAYDQARPRLNVLSTLLRAAKGRTVADISTGLGFLPVLVARQGAHVIATEVGEGTSSFARAHGIEVRRYRLGAGTAPIEPGTLDVLIFAEVLEHVKSSPVAILRELAACLRPGGTLLLTTPNVARLQHLEALAAGENFLEAFPQELPLDQDATDHIEHVREYSIREVVEAVEGAGLAIDRVLMTGWGDAGYHPLPNPFANEIIVVEAHT